MLTFQQERLTYENLRNTQTNKKLVKVKFCTFTYEQIKLVKQTFVMKNVVHANAVT